VPGKTVVLWKIHHCLVDGVSGVDLTTVVFDFSADAELPEEQDWEPAPMPSPGDAWMRAMEDTFRSQFASARQTIEQFGTPEAATRRATALAETSQRLMQTMMQPIVGAPWNTSGVVTSRRAFAWCKYPFAAIRAMRGPLGGTVNDIVLTILSEAGARYIREKGIEPGAEVMRIGCPVSVRAEGEGGALGNRVSMMFPTLPGRPMSPVERLTRVQAETGRLKESREAQGLEQMMQAQDFVPATLQGMASLVTMASADSAATLAAAAPIPPRLPIPIPSFGINFVATNVPGVQVAQYLAGHELLDTVGLIPLGGSMGYGVAIGTYNQNLYFGLMAEPRIMPDVDRMKSLCDEVYEELVAAANGEGPE
jgi:WS/DGAT/MGAT family acyltransferase